MSYQKEEKTTTPRQGGNTSVTDVDFQGNLRLARRVYMKNLLCFIMPCVIYYTVSQQGGRSPMEGDYLYQSALILLTLGCSYLAYSCATMNWWLKKVCRGLFLSLINLRPAILLLPMILICVYAMRMGMIDGFFIPLNLILFATMLMLFPTKSRVESELKRLEEVKAGNASQS